MNEDLKNNYTKKTKSIVFHSLHRLWKTIIHMCKTNLWKLWKTSNTQ